MAKQQQLRVRQGLDAMAREGTPVPHLRSGELYLRLACWCKRQGFQQSEMPSERTFFRALREWKAEGTSAIGRDWQRT